MLIAFMLLLTTHSRAASAAAPKTDPEISVLALTAGDAVKKALKNNLDLKIEAISPETAKNRLESAEAAFAPVVNLRGTVNRSRSRGDFFVTDFRGTRFNIGMEKRFHSGVRASAGISTSESETDPSFTSGDDHAASAELNLTVPLIKNMGRGVNTRDIVLSGNNLRRTELSGKRAIIETAAQARILYWNLYKAERELEVQRNSLKLAEKFERLNKGRLELGSIAPSDALQAEAEVASRGEWVIIAENGVKRKERELLHFIFSDYGKNRRVRLVQRPAYEKRVLVERELLEFALANQPDYLMEKLNIKNANINLAYAKNQVFPAVDLNATMQITGTGADRSGAWRKAEKGHDWNGTATLGIRFPWGLKQERAALNTSMCEKKRAVIKLVQKERRIISEVKNAMDNVAEADGRYRTTTLAETLAGKKLVAEEKKFKLGISTAYNVLLYQRDLTAAAVRKVNALIDWQIAVINLYRIIGSPEQLIANH